ncbi:MAG: hypothetical protein JWQ66_3165 [Mucilaginibacter sp.]|nr:hypothetical protein [Mucilaginibacter sp.]
MEIKRNGSQPSGKGLAEYFTGSVRIDPSLTHRSRAGFRWRWSPLNRVHVLHGILTRLDRP